MKKVVEEVKNALMWRKGKEKHRKKIKTAKRDKNYKFCNVEFWGKKLNEMELTEVLQI